MTYTHDKRPNTPEWMTCENCTWSCYNDNNSYGGELLCTRYPKVYIESYNGVSQWQYPKCGYACGEFRYKHISWNLPS